MMINRLCIYEWRNSLFYKFRTNKSALLYIVWYSVLRAKLGSPFGRAVGAADWEGKIWPYQRTTANWKTPGGCAERWRPTNESSGIFSSANIRWRFINSESSGDLSQTFIVLLPSWLLNWMVLNTMSLRGWPMILSVPHFWQRLDWRFCDFPTETSTGIFAACVHKLILPFKSACKALSVTFGDSSPRGRAKRNACNCAIRS